VAAGKIVLVNISRAFKISRVKTNRMAFCNKPVNGKFPQCAAASATRIVYVVVAINIDIHNARFPMP
jgi:hypothetical protein